MRRAGDGGGGPSGQTEMREDRDDDRDDLQPATAVWAVLDSDLEDALKQAVDRPAKFDPKRIAAIFFSTDRFTLGSVVGEAIFLGSPQETDVVVR